MKPGDFVEAKWDVWVQDVYGTPFTNDGSAMWFLRGDCALILTTSAVSTLPELQKLMLLLPTGEFGLVYDHEVKLAIKGDENG